QTQQQRQDGSPQPLIDRTPARSAIEPRRRIDQQETSEQRDPLCCWHLTVPVLHEGDETGADERSQQQRQVAKNLQYRSTTAVTLEEAEHSWPGSPQTAF